MILGWTDIVWLERISKENGIQRRIPCQSSSDVRIAKQLEWIIGEVVSSSQWFWQVFHKMNEKDKRKFLRKFFPDRPVRLNCLRLYSIMKCTSWAFSVASSRSLNVEDKRTHPRSSFHWTSEIFSSSSGWKMVISLPIHWRHATLSDLFRFNQHCQAVNRSNSIASREERTSHADQFDST